MTGQAVTVTAVGGMLRIGLCRPQQRNSINAVLIAELNEALNLAEATPECRLVVLEGSDGVFCAGMDLVAAGRTEAPDRATAAESGEQFSGLLRRLTALPRAVIARVDGQVVGGGVGLVAASDLVIATPRSQFSLPEALWGLLPCCVAPYLIRRVGFQKAFALALTTQPVTAEQAHSFHLVDEVAENTETVVRRLAFRTTKIAAPTIGHLKRYFGQLAPISREHERLAVSELAGLMSSAEVHRHLRNFVWDQRYPWEGVRS